jgi:hypothetical protein
MSAAARVYDLADERLRRAPTHVVGTGRCVGCNHEGIIIAAETRGPGGITCPCCRLRLVHFIDGT